METIQDESIISPDKGSIDNNNNDKVRHNEDLEHKRQSFLEILKQRKIFIDSETGKLINDHTDIQTLFHIIEKEREKDMMKAKALPEAFLNPDKLAVMKMRSSIMQSLTMFGTEATARRDLMCELTMTWLLLLAINPLTGWFFHPFVFGCTQ